MNMPWAR